MAYQGNSPAANFQSLPAVQRFNGTGSATAFTLASVIPNDQSILVSVDGVTQDSNAYAVNGTTLTFTAAPSSGTGNIFVNTISPVGSTVVPPDGSVTTAKLAAGVLLSWQAVQTSAFTAVASRGYPCNTTSSAFTVTLPSSANVGDSIQIVDYAGTFNVNNITLTSSLNIEGRAADKELTTNREGVTITYVDATQGWIATSGVNSGDQALDPAAYTADFLVIAGGGGGGSQHGGAGGAGGYRNSYSTESSGGGGSSETSLAFDLGTTYTVTVGAGGAGGSAGGNNTNSGSNSVISGTGITTITSNGGGAGASWDYVGTTGGSGGGDAGPVVSSALAGTANQGYAGGVLTSAGGHAGGGGGGASAVGANATGTGFSDSTGGAGGAGLASSITASSVTRGGGGGGGCYSNVTAAAGGSGGGGTGGTNGNGGGTNPTAGTANTGGGGGGGQRDGVTGGAGGAGVVILRMPTASYSGTTSGSPTVSTSGTDTILVYNASGSYTA